jgi:hypothetical protein
MSVLVSIGDFSRMTHLSIKALRFYQDQGLLEPARIDPATGYPPARAGHCSRLASSSWSRPN